MELFLCSSFFFFFFFWSFVFLGPHPKHMEVPRLEVDLEMQPQAYARATATHIWATSVTYTRAHSNAGFLTHWARPGIEPATSRFLVGFVSAAPQQELLLRSSCSTSPELSTPLLLKPSLCIPSRMSRFPKSLPDHSFSVFSASSSPIKALNVGASQCLVLSLCSFPQLMASVPAASKPNPQLSWFGVCSSYFFLLSSRLPTGHYANVSSLD